MNTKNKRIQLFCFTILFALSSVVYANKLNDISYSSLPGDLLQIRLSMSEPAVMPVVFTIDNPARIAMDLANTEIALKEKTTSIGINNARSITAVKAGDRTRVVLNLAKMVNYNTTLEGNDIVLTLNTSGTSQPAVPAPSSVPQQSIGENIQNIDFRRGEKGEGRVMISLADPNTAIDIKKRGKDVIVTVKDSKLPENLERRLDVIDFATLVKTVDAFNHGNDVRLIISATKDFDHIAYQTNDTFTVDVKPIVKLKKATRKREYKGERLSLNFQSIDVRAVLQLIADFTGLNLITSDSVKGNLTLRLKNVPWDQALDIVLKSKGLGMEKQGNVISVAPISEIAARNKVENSIEANAPLFSESIQINYAKANDLAKLVKSKDTSLLSKRGRVSVDTRTNRILIKDTSKNIEDVVALIKELDIPIRQVLIESRIVLATDTFSESLGVRFSAARDYVSLSDGRRKEGDFNVNLPVAGSTLGLAVSRLPVGTLVDLELSAAQTEGDSETISSPRVITSDRNEATILTGTEIPYESTDAEGNTTTTFKEANLELTVTPQITPDDRVIMDLEVNKDEPDYGNTTEAGPPINTNRVRTQVLVDNGETVVLGGIYDQTKGTTFNRVPFLGEIPLIGVLFRSRVDINNKAELLIFVTPKILKDKASL
ncbi:MAG: type IV pilus secretin PilQ [Gammaproteobacteria bacterium]